MRPRSILLAAAFAVVAASAHASGVYYPQPAPYAGHVNHAFTAPPFRWGWFGADHHYPRVGWQRNYQGVLIRRSIDRRY